MSSRKDPSFGNPTFLEKVGSTVLLLVYLPLALGWTVLTSPFHRTNKHKSYSRIVGDRAFYFLTKHLNVGQLQWILGDTLDVYTAYMKRQKRPLVIDELKGGGRLLWLGERRTDRVILYFHGGAYLLPAQFFVLPFWKYVSGELKSKNKETGFAILQYSLVNPSATFPTQLEQAVLAVQHLLSVGVQPQDIQLAGDSAGGNLVLELFSHILHPVPDIPRLTLPAPFGGAYTMSPWVSLTGETGSMLTNGDSDVIGIEALTYWGRLVLQGVPERFRPYLEAYNAPVDWFMKLPTVVERVLITAGDAECLRDEIVIFVDRLKEHHPKVQFLVQNHGIHNDPYFDFLWPWSVKGNLTPLIVDFFASNFR